MSSSISWPVSSSLPSPSSLSCYLFLFCLFSLPCASLIWTVVIRFRVCSDNPRWSHLKMKWFISAKLLFPNKIIYRQLPGIQRWPTHWGVTIKTTTILWLVSPPINLLSQQIVLWGSCSVTQLCPTVCDHMNCSLPGSSCPWNFSGKNIGVCCHFPTPGDHPNPGIESVSFASPILVGRFLPLPPPGKPKQFHIDYYKFLS